MQSGIKTYTATSNQSMYDVCLATYGSADLLYKLMKDNGVKSTGYRPQNGQVFKYDASLVVDLPVNQLDYRYTTAGNIQFPAGAYILTEDSDETVNGNFLPFCFEHDTNKLFLKQWA